jgi:uncharacterized repeat protein (TIGR01451 family)
MMDLKKLFSGSSKKIATLFSGFYRKLRDFKLKMKWSKNNIIIIVVVISALLLSAIGAGFYYYFRIYNAPNFEDELFNKVTTSSEEKINPGDKLSYEVDYKNSGYRDVDELKIIIPIPENTSLESSTEGGVYDDRDETLEYRIENLDAGSSGSVSFILKVKNPLDNDTRISIGEVRFEYSVGEENFTKLLESGPGHIVESSPEFSSFSFSSKDVNGGLLSLGDEIEYSVNIKNTGNMTAEQVRVINRLSPYLKFKDVSSGGSAEYDDGELIWDIGKISPGGSETLVFRAELEAGEVNDKEEIISTAEVFYLGESKYKKETVDVARLFPDFSESSVAVADANGGTYLWAGETVSVKINLKNTGEREADEYSLFCPVPEPATYVSRSGTAEGIEWSDDIRGLIWRLDSLGVGQSKEINFNMTVNEDYFFRSGTITTEFYVIAGDERFDIEPVSINIQGHPYLNVVAMGDSLIARSDWVQRLDQKLEAAYPAAEYNTVASAISGEMSFEGLARFDSTVGPLRPHILIVAYGTNDTGISYSYFQYSIDSIVAKARGMGATVFINTIGPISLAGKSDWPKYNQAIMEVSAKYGVPVIDVASVLSQNPGRYFYDGMHYTPEGSEAVAQTVFNNVSQYLNSLGGRR